MYNRFSSFRDIVQMQIKKHLGEFMQYFLREFYKLYRKLYQDVNVILKEFNMSIGLWRVMLYLDKHEKCRAKDIYEFFQMDKGLVSRNINKLIEIDYVEHEIFRGKVTKNILLTEEGKRIYGLISEKIRNHEKFILSIFTDKEKKCLFDLLNKMNGFEYDILI